MKKEVSRVSTALEWTLSAAALATVVIVIASVDSPASQYAGSMAKSLTPAGGGIGMPEPVTRVFRTAWRICMDHQPLAAFAAVATVLVLFMRRMR